MNDEQLISLCRRYLEEIIESARAGMLEGMDPAVMLAELVDNVATGAQSGYGRQDSYNAMRHALYRMDLDPDDLRDESACERRVFNGVGELEETGR